MLNNIKYYSWQGRKKYYYLDVKIIITYLCTDFYK